MFYSLYQGVQFEGLEGANPPFFADQLDETNSTPAPTYTLANFFTSITPSSYNLPPLTFYEIDPHAPIPQIQQWNFAVQKVIHGALSVQVGYVGNKATHLAFSEPVNVPSPAPGAIQSRRIDPAFAEGYLLQEVDNSNFNSLQIKAETRSWRDLYALSTFVWDKGFDVQYGDFQSTPSIQNPNCIECEYGVNPSWPAVRFTLGAVYAIPFLRNKTGLEGSLLGGWEVTSIVGANNGYPFTPTIGTDPANTGTPMRPNRMGGGKLSSPTLHEWFNLSAFTVPAQYTYGDSANGILDGPGAKDWDLGFYKNFKVSKLGEQGRLQFRAECFNFTNTPSFSNPQTNIQATTAGEILSTSSAPREIQFALKLFF
jgi:hypothetical protein